MGTGKPTQEGTGPALGHSHVTMAGGHGISDNCRVVSGVLSRIGDKWSVLVVMLLSGEPRRFNELKRMIGGISQRMLTRTLRGLERDGLVKRTLYPSVPPRVDYELTALGRSLQKPVEALGLWAFKNGEAIEASRRLFDASHGAD
jgi:DNA-binding HxlR family transcriptional regulator